MTCKDAPGRNPAGRAAIRRSHLCKELRSFGLGFQNVRICGPYAKPGRQRSVSICILSATAGGAVLDSDNVGGIATRLKTRYFGVVSTPVCHPGANPGVESKRTYDVIPFHETS